MVKKVQLTKQKKNTEFELSALNSNPNPYYKKKIRLSLRVPSNKKRSRKNIICHPVFNNDGLFYTPAFLDESDMCIPQQIQKILKKQYLQKLNNSDEKQTNILTSMEQFSDASPQNNLCCVCKSKFSDYGKHISQQNHLNNIRNSVFSDDIQKMCNQYQNQNPLSHSFQPFLLSTNILFLEQINQISKTVVNTFRHGYFQQSQPFQLIFY